MKDVDTIEYNSIKRTIMLTRNPPHFESVYNEKNERIAVKYNKEFDQEVDIKKWVTGWKTKFESEFAGMELAKDDKYVVEELECLPTKFEDFVNTFVDGLSIKNALMFQKRIQGLVSYFKGADERLLPRRIDEENTTTINYIKLKPIKLFNTAYFIDKNNHLYSKINDKYLDAVAKNLCLL
jgi:hypothetical protein